MKCCEECEDLKTEFFDFLGKLIIYKASGEVSLVEQDTIECFLSGLFRFKKKKYFAYSF